MKALLLATALVFTLTTAADVRSYEILRNKDHKIIGFNNFPNSDWNVRFYSKITFDDLYARGHIPLDQVLSIVYGDPNFSTSRHILQQYLLDWIKTHGVHHIAGCTQNCGIQAHHTYWDSGWVPLILGTKIHVTHPVLWTTREGGNPPYAIDRNVAVWTQK